MLQDNSSDPEKPGTDDGNPQQDSALVPDADSSPWHIKFTYLILIFFVSVFISSSLWIGLFPDYFSENPPPMSVALLDYVFYGILFYFIYVLGKRAAIDWNLLMGSVNREVYTWKHFFAALFLIALSLAGTYILYLPLSYIVPGFVKNYLLEPGTQMTWREGENHLLANILSLFNVSVYAPFVEEIFFRGFILTSISVKWGIKKGIIFSSLLFAICHADILGSFIFSVVVAVLYVNTRSLLVPVLIHCTNNLLAFIFDYVNNMVYGPQKYTIEQFRDEWFYGAAALIIAIPWLIYFYRKEIKEFGVSGHPFYLRQK